MNDKSIKEMMIPVSDYPSISENATLGEARLALEKARQHTPHSHQSFQSVLVVNDKNEIIGKISPMDILVGLEPKYKRFGDMALLSRFGYSPGFYDYILKNIDLLQKPLDDLCRKAAAVKVADIMSEHQINTRIEADASLNHAIHQLVISNQQSLLVCESNQITGVLRLVDVVEALGDYMTECVLDPA